MEKVTGAAKHFITQKKRFLERKNQPQIGILEVDLLVFISFP